MPYLILIILVSSFRLELTSSEIISWVPPYNRPVCQEMSKTKFGSYGPATALTTLSLQWWTLTENGDLKRVEQYGKINDEEIEYYTTWGKENKVKILLCIYNGVQKWDWDIAKKGFADNKDKLIQQLIQTIDKYNLDGIDIDFEGKGSKDKNSQMKLKEFIIQLSKALKNKQKSLSINSFHSPYYNAPNMSWWKDWLDHVDSIQVMGYQDLYEGNLTTLQGKPDHLFKYSWQQSFGTNLGYQPKQIALGLPSNFDSWGSGGRGSTALAHIQECLHDCKTPASIAIWDLQLQGKNTVTGWRSEAVWKALTEMAHKE